MFTFENVCVTITKRGMRMESTSEKWNDKEMKKKKFGKNRIVTYVSITIACLSMLTLILFGVVRLIRSSKNEKQLDELRGMVNEAEEGMLSNVANGPDAFGTGTPTPSPKVMAQATYTPTLSPTPKPIVISERMAGVYERNNDIVGWIRIEGSKDPEIDYPVMQTQEDPNTPEKEGEFYIDKGIDKETLPGGMGSIFMDHRSESGVGYKENDYAGGTKPSNIMLLYGHNTKGGLYFGYLYQFLNTDYALEHKYIDYDTLYEHRRYEVVSCFRSHVFMANEYMDRSNLEDPNFKYYQFADYLNEEEFVYWYANVVSHNETDLEEYQAVYGDEFLVLSTCSSTDEKNKRNSNGRLCLVAVRVE